MPREFLRAGTLCSIYLERKRQCRGWIGPVIPVTHLWVDKSWAKSKKKMLFGVPNLPSCNELCLLWLWFGFSEWYRYSWLELLYYYLFTKPSRDQKGDNVKKYKHKHTLVPCGSCSWLCFLFLSKSLMQFIRMSEFTQPPWWHCWMLTLYFIWHKRNWSRAFSLTKLWKRINFSCSCRYLFYWLLVFPHLPSICSSKLSATVSLIPVLDHFPGSQWDVVFHSVGVWVFLSSTYMLVIVGKSLTNFLNPFSYSIRVPILKVWCLE